MKKTFSSVSYFKDEASGYIVLIMPVTKDWLRIIYEIFWLVGWTAGIVIFTVAFIIGEKHNFPFIFILLIMLSGELLVLRKLAWDLTGKETLAITAEDVTIKKENLWFSKPGKFSLKEISGTRIIEGSGELRSLSGSGKIHLLSSSRNIPFGIHLTDRKSTRLNSSHIPLSR